MKWLCQNNVMRSVSGDVKVVEERRELTGLDGAWQVGLVGTLRKESVRTVAVVVDRPGGRVVLLLAGPAGAWEQVRPAVAGRPLRLGQAVAERGLAEPQIRRRCMQGLMIRQRDQHFPMS